MKTAPNDIQAEKALLGTLLTFPQMALEAEGIIQPESFYAWRHQTVYKSILRLNQIGTPAGLGEVSKDLDSHGELEGAGGNGYLVECTEAMEAKSRVPYYVQRIREMADRRALIVAHREGEAEAYDLTKPTDRVIAESEARILSVGFVGEVEPVLIGDVVRSRVLSLDEDIEYGVPSGSRFYRDITLDFLPKKVYVIAAHPGKGKTAKALGHAVGAASKGFPVAFFSLEMSREELGARALSSFAQINSRRILTKTADPDEKDRAALVVDYAQMPIIIDDSSYDIEIILARARRWVRKFGVKLVVIDYLQKLRTVKQFRSDAGEIKYFAEALKAFAKSEDVTVLALAQLTKSEAVRPAMNDLYGSKWIENEADVIELLYSPRESGELEPLMIDGPQGKQVDAYEQLVIGMFAKVRHLETRSALYRFDKPTTTFSDWDGHRPLFKQQKNRGKR